MKATVVGATVPAKALRAACAKADLSPKDVRVVGARAWVELPHETRDAVLARLAEALATGLMVVDVTVSEGGLSASRATYRGVEEDVSDEARQLVVGRDRVGASEVAWALVGDADGAAPAQSSAEEQWAHALVDKLVADGLVELRGTQRPTGGLAQILQNPGRDVGDRLLAELIDSPAIDEVFADADQLAAAARATRKR
jgi:hypothetical protein